MLINTLTFHRYYTSKTLHCLEFTLHFHSPDYKNLLKLTSDSLILRIFESRDTLKLMQQNSSIHMVLPLSSKNDVQPSMPVLPKKLHSQLNVEILKIFMYIYSSRLNEADTSFKLNDPNHLTVCIPLPYFEWLISL